MSAQVVFGRIWKQNSNARSQPGEHAPLKAARLYRVKRFVWRPSTLTDVLFVAIIFVYQDMIEV